MRRRIIVRQVNNQARPVRLATLVGSAVAVALGFAGGPAHAASGPSGAPPSVAPLISSEAVRPDTMGAAGVLPISAPDASQAVPDLPPPIVKSDPIVPIAAGKGMQPLATGGGLAGNGYYRFVDSDEVGNPEAPVSNFRDIRTLGTVVAGISDDECVSVDLSAGALPPFTFKYFDVDYTTVFVCGNGQISFGAADNRFSNLCPPTGGAAVGGAIFGLWDDWRVAANGRILTYTFGTAPNRVFVAQWEQVSSFAEPAETDTFQIQLLERSGDIRVEYQNVDSGQPDGLALYPSPDNHYLVGSETGDKLTRFQAAGAFDGVHVRSGEAGLDGPSGVAIGDGVAGGVGDVTVDGVDDVFVGSFNTDQIMVYNGSHPGTQLNDGYFLTPFVAAGSGGLDGPRGVRFGPDGNLYVSSFNNDRVLKYNGTTGASISTFVAAGAGGLDGPDDLVFGPDGNLYVSSYNNDRVIKYDGTTGAVIGTFVAAGSGGLDGPRGLAFGAADGNLYVASENTDQVLRYAGGNGDFFNVAVAAGQNGLNEPRFIQFNSTGNLLVVSHGSNRVLEFSVPLVTFLTGALPSFPEGVAFNGGFLYVSSRSTSEVLRYNATTGAFVGVFVTSGSGGLNGPQDLVFGPTGDLYVSSIASNEVKRYNGTTGAFISTFVTAGLGGLDQPHGLRFGTGGDLFVASENSHEIKRYNGTTGAFISNFVTASSGGLTFPHGIVFNAGDLYVSSFGTDQVKRYNGTTGAFISNFVATGSGGLDDPVGLVFGGPSNDLFVVSNVNSRVLAYNGSTGAFIGTFAPSGSGGLSGPRMLTFGPDGRLYISSRFTNQVMTTAATFVRAVDTGGDRSRGRSATVGLDGPNGTLGLQYACNPGGGIGAPIVKEDLSVLFVAPPPAGADLRVVYKRVNNPMPTEDEVITYEIKIQNDGRFNATGVTVLDQLPSELTYVSSSATAGSYNSGTGIWTVGSLALAQMETLTIQARVNQGTARTPGRFDSEFVIADGSPSPAAPFGRLRRPDGIVRDPVTGNWLVSSFDTDQILRYSSTGAFVNILVDRQPDTACSTPGLGCLRGPVGLVIRAGLLYVASSETNQVLRFDAATGAPLGEFVGPNPLFPYPNGIAGPRGLVFDASGNLYVSNALNSQVRRYSPGGGFTGVVAANKDDPNPGVFGTFPNSTLSGPDGIVFGPDRNGDAVPDLYVASRTSTEILVFDVVTSSQIGTGALFNSSDGLSGPSGIALSADQRFLYVANFGLNQILQLDLLFPTTGLQLVATAQGGLLSPEAIAIQPNGDLLVASTGSHQILGFGHTVTGAFEGVIASTGVNGVRALKVGPTDQRLYAAVLDPSSSAKIFIRRYDPTTNIEDSSPFFNGDVLTSACAIGIGSVNFVYDMEMSPDGKLVFLSVGVSCISGFTSAIVILNGPTGSSPGTIAGVVRFSGATAFGLAIGPNNDLFVARDWTGFLSPPDDILRLDGATGAFIGVFASGGLINAPRGLTYAPDGNLYLANRGPNTILRIDGTTAAVTDPAGFNPVGGIEDVQYGPDGNLYGTTHPGAVERWSLVTGTAVPSFGGGILNVPGDIVFLAEGDVVVADTGNNRIVRFDGHAQFQGVFAQVRYGPTTPGLNCARYLTFGPDGNMYVSSEYTDRVLRYNGTTGAFIDTFVDETSGLDGPRDIVFGPDGKFYVASRNNDRILRYNGTTGVYDGSPYVPGAFFGSGGLSGPEAMAFGPDDDLLYVSSNLGNQILRYFDVGSIFGAFPIPPPFVDFGGAPSLIAPRGLAFGPDGDLYVSTPSGIFQYARSTGAFVQIFSHGGPLAGAADLTFGPDGNLYVVSSGSNEVLVYQGPQVAMPMSPGDYLGSFLITEPGEPAPIEPTGLVFGPNGDLFVSSCGSHNVIRYRGFIANRAIVDGTSNPAHVPNDPNLSNNVGTVAVTVKGADFEIQKTVDDNTPYEGDTVTYTVSVTNHGPLAGIQVQVTDVLPPQLTYVGSTPSQGSYNPGTGFWTIGALPVNATATLTIQATVNNGVAVAFPVVTNTATVDDLAPTVGDPDLRNNTASVDIFLVFADLAVTKSVDLATANEGQTVEFTINVVNNGLNDATGVQIRDRLPSGLAFVSATTPPGTTYNPISGLWVIGNLANGANLTLLLRGQVLTGTGGLTLTNAATVAASSLPDPDPSNDTATADVTVRGADLSIVKTVSPPPPGGYTFGTPLTFTIVVTNNGPLNATGVTARDRLPIGLTYISHVASGGTYDPVSGVWMIGALAASATRTLTINATFAASASGSVANIATVSAQTGDQNLENNRSAVVIGVPNIDLDIIIVSRPAQVYPDPAESAAALDLARRAHDVPADDANAEPPADVDGTDAADPDATTPRPPLLPGPGIAGNGLFYDITVRNDGKSTATGVVLTAILDPDVHYITDNDVPQCVEAPVGTLKCQFGAIEAGGSKTITVQTEVEPQAYVTRLLGAQPLVLTLRASVMADQQDTDILDDVEVHLTHLVDLADARIFKVSKPDDAVRAGQIFTYTLLVENLGPSLARDLQFDDSILSSGVFTLVGTQLDPGRDDVCVAAPAPAPLSGQILRCTLNEPLEPVGSGLGTGRWTVQVTARATQTQDIDNEVRLYSRDGVSARVGTPDPRLGNNVAVDSISILDTSDLRLTKSEVGVVRSSTVCATTTNVPNNVTAGEQLTWTIVVTNGVPAFGLPGGSIATNVTVFDAVPAGLEIVSIAGVGPAAAAAGCHAGTPGDPSDRARCVFASLAPGASGTVTIVARVDAGYVGASGTNQIVNSAWTSSDNIDPFQDDNVATQITAVSEVADLSIQKLATPNPVIAGQALSYELVIANAGPSNGRSVLVRDVLPAQLAYVSARIENQRDREQCTFSEGANEVICSLFDVPVG
ncbi:MAG: beta-propeller fold lactonase family protein, partial [Ardenticatenales bacterium]